MKKKLHLSKERLRTLSHNELLQVASGSATNEHGATLNNLSDRCNVLRV